MLIDCSLKVTQAMRLDAQGNETKALTGHLGTHFDVMNKEFPLSFTQRNGIVFDVSQVKNRDIEIKDINLERVQKDSFVAFYTGFNQEEKYGTVRYFKEHPQLSNKLIDALLLKKVSIIGIDAAGIRRGLEHTSTDQKCADHNVFVVENLCNLDLIVNRKSIIHTYPINFEGYTGLPTRVIAEIEA